MRLAKRLAKSGFGIGCAVGLILTLGMTPAVDAALRTASSTAAFTCSTAPSLPAIDFVGSATTIWPAAWGIQYDDQDSAMTILPVAPGEWVVHVHSQTAPNACDAKYNQDAATAYNDFLAEIQMCGILGLGEAMLCSFLYPCIPCMFACGILVIYHAAKCEKDAIDKYAAKLEKYKEDWIACYAKCGVIIGED